MLKPISLPWTRWLILWSLVGLLLAIAPEPTDTAAVTTWQKGVRLAAEGERREAEKAYRQVITRRPFDPQPWRHLGDLYLAWGRSDDAHHAYGQAIRRGEHGAALDRGLAQLYADLGDYRRSAQRWTNYLARRPNDRVARLTLAQTAIRLADWERARTVLEHLATGDPPDPAAHAWLGLLLIGPNPARGTFHLRHAAEDSALTVFLAPVLAAERLSAASDDPAYRSALLGEAFLKLDVSPLLQHLQPDAIESTNTANRRSVEPPDYAAVARAFTPATSMLALRSLLAATYHNPTYADAYAYLGQALDRLGWSGWAQASFETALHFGPQSPVVLTLAGLYWDRHDAPALARFYYQTAYYQDPNNAALCLEIAATYAAQGEYTSGEVWLLHATQIAPNNPQVWETLAHFYLDYGIGVQESGLPAATRLLELTPGNAHAHDLMGWAYFLIQEDTLAETHLNQALTLNPTLAAAHYHLGRLYARQGLYAKAAQAYRRADSHDVRGQLTVELDRAWNDLPQAYRE